MDWRAASPLDRGVEWPGATERAPSRKAGGGVPKPGRLGTGLRLVVGPGVRGSTDG